MTAPDTPTPDALIALLPRLRRYARVLTADVRRADALVLETLGCASGGGQSSRAPWPQLRHRLFAVMHRLHRDRWVDVRRKPPLSAPVPGRADADDVLARFARLPAEQREVLALVVLEGLPYTEVAEVLEVPVATVLSRLRSAREAMGPGTAGSEPPRSAGT